MISASGHGKEVVNGLNDIDERYIYQLMYTVHLPGKSDLIQINNGNQTDDVSLAKDIPIASDKRSPQRWQTKS